MPPHRSSLHHPHAYPPSASILLRNSPDSLTLKDHLLVILSSGVIFGSFFWIPLLLRAAYRKWKSTPAGPRKKMWGSLLVGVIAIFVTGPHRSVRVGSLLQFRSWRLFKAWENYLALEVVADRREGEEKEGFNIQTSQAILAIIPHGIIPFSLGLAALPISAHKAFGSFRPVVATATIFFPFVRTLLSWMGSVDASRSAVNQALAEKSRLGIAVGGISEMFLGYPKPFTHPNDEFALLRRRKGFIRMAIAHGVPVLPVYCFGATKMFKRLDVALLEKMSNFFRVSVCLMFGKFGLPMPFRQKLLYVIGNPIFPNPNNDIYNVDDDDDDVIDEMHGRFCEELLRIFEKYKDSYGWDKKTLHLL